jgi:hypothetical protein
MAGYSKAIPLRAVPTAFQAVSAPWLIYHPYMVGEEGFEPITPKDWFLRQAWLPLHHSPVIGATGEIRTRTEPGLSRLTLPLAYSRKSWRPYPAFQKYHPGF